MIGAGLAALGLLQVTKGWQAIRDASASAHWPHTVGNVVTSDVQISQSTSRHGNGFSYSPRVIYHYTAGHRAYTGSVIMPGRLWGGRSSSAEVDRYPVGAAPQVFYSPQNPSDSLLEPGLHRFNFGTLVAGIGILLFGAIPLAFAYYATLENPPAQSNLPLIIVPGLFLVFGLLIWLA